MMTLKEYQKRAHLLAVYPTDVGVRTMSITMPISMSFRPYPLVYPLLKLSGECGELLAATHALADAKQAPPRDNGASMRRAQRAFLRESGDVLWYLAECATVLAFELPTEAEGAAGGGFAPERYLAELVVAALAANERYGKLIRDEPPSVSGDPNMRAAAHAELKTNVQKAALSLYRLIAAVELTLDEVIEANLEKLESRAARGVIHGSGDER